MKGGVRQVSVQTIEVMAQWVQEHIEENPTLKQMSLHVGYSPFYCSAQFRQHMGVTYKQYLARCRLTAAAQDLRSTQHKIIDIAMRYGYASPESLARAFAAHYRCSPRQYRQACAKRAQPDEWQNIIDCNG